MSQIDKSKPIQALPAMPRTDQQLKDYLRALFQYFPDEIKLHDAKLSSAQKLGGTCTKLGNGRYTIRISRNFDTRVGFLATALHELSHAYEWQTYGDSNHGKRFMAINDAAIASMGLSEVIKASRCHSEDLRVKKAKKIPLRKASAFKPTSRFTLWCKANNYQAGYNPTAILTYQALTGLKAG